MADSGPNYENVAIPKKMNRVYLITANKLITFVTNTNNLIKYSVHLRASSKNRKIKVLNLEMVGNFKINYGKAIVSADFKFRINRLNKLSMN